MIDPDAAIAYLRFVEARHQVWAARQAGLPGPWTDEPIVATRKFTNVFRVLDFGSQYLFGENLLEGRKDDVLMRLFLYRHTGRPEAWDYLLTALGGPPTIDDLEFVAELFKEYRGAGARPVFTSAYLVFPQSQVKGTDKVDSIVALTRRLFEDEGLAESFLAADSQVGRFAELRKNKGVADFMSMQILTDWGYSPYGEDRENDFIVLGPGARKGALALDPTAKTDDTFRWAYESVYDLGLELPLDTPMGMGRLPSYMDVQNTLCEFSKYVRYAERPVPDKPYAPAHPGPQEPPLLPHHWSH